MTSAERSAYPLFPKLVMARELHVFYTPSPDEVVWARERTDTDDHLLAFTLALKCFQKMARFSKRPEVPPIRSLPVGLIFGEAAFDGSQAGLDIDRA